MKRKRNAALKYFSLEQYNFLKSVASGEWWETEKVMARYFANNNVYWRNVYSKYQEFIPDNLYVQGFLKYRVDCQYPMLSYAEWQEEKKKVFKNYVFRKDA